MIRTILIILSLIAMLHSAVLIAPLVQFGAFRPDFSVFWTAARMASVNPAQLYDAEAMTAAQSWLTSPANGLRPFVYPPTALLFFGPLGMMPFPVAFIIWTGFSLVAYVVSARRFGSPPAIALALVTPPVALALATGQSALLTASAIMMAVAIVDYKPLLAGILFGAAAMVKPQGAILLPLALMVAGNWRALLAFVAAGLGLAGVATLLWGGGLWIEWLDAMVRFSSIVTQLGLNVEGITPAMLARAAAWPQWLALSVQTIAAIGGCALIVWAFRRPDPATRLVALASGSLLCSPYALMYDLAVLMPVAAAALLSGGRGGIFAGFAMTGLAGAASLPALIASRLTGAHADRTALDN